MDAKVINWKNTALQNSTITVSDLKKKKKRNINPLLCKV